jgi:hypothetical protein
MLNTKITRPAVLGWRLASASLLCEFMFQVKLESNELAFMEEHLENWESQVTKQVPHRKVKTLVIDISGKSVCITRFFRPLAPPGK